MITLLLIEHNRMLAVFACAVGVQVEPHEQHTDDTHTRRGSTGLPLRKGFQMNRYTRPSYPTHAPLLLMPSCLPPPPHAPFYSFAFLPLPPPPPPLLFEP